MCTLASTFLIHALVNCSRSCFSDRFKPGRQCLIFPAMITKNCRSTYCILHVIIFKSNNDSFGHFALVMFLCEFSFRNGVTLTRFTSTKQSTKSQPKNALHTSAHLVINKALFMQRAASSLALLPAYCLLPSDLLDTNLN